MGKIIISEVMDRQLLFLIDEQSHPQFIKVLSDEKEDSLTGNIYVGRVSDVVPGIQGAFVSISNHQKVFLPFRECCTQESAIPLRQGDELLVQITASAIKTKLPEASTKLHLAGKYCVCRLNEHGISFSKKISSSKESELKAAITSADMPGRKGYGFIIRTNAGLLSDAEPLLDEMRQFIDIFEQISQTGKYRTIYSCLYRGEEECIKAVKNIPTDQYSEIVTDIPYCYEKLKDCKAAVRLYQDESLPLAKLYSLETHLKQALSKKVWLPGGGYLIIEPTEAMTVIDVNSGKGSNQKGMAQGQLYLKINREAALEIARQLRLRNLSGMIMVDFINMGSAEEEQNLLAYLKECLEKDTVKTRLVDMTALGIVEITRKKENRPLADSFPVSDMKI